MSASVRHVFTLVARFMLLLLILSLMLFASVGIVFAIWLPPIPTIKPPTLNPITPKP